MTITDLPSGFTFTDERPDQDTTPPSFDVEHPCQVCGKEVEYGGRGPRPKFCREHRKQSAGRTKAPGAKGSNVTLAEQATEALWQVNGMVAFLAMIAGFPLTGQEIQARETVFREMCYSALLTDPNTCRFILKGGMQSSKISLVMCYAMFLGGIAPSFMQELKERKAAKIAAQEEYERTMNFVPEV
jgi:hypothetical protein